MSRSCYLVSLFVKINIKFSGCKIFVRVIFLRYVKCLDIIPHSVFVMQFSASQECYEWSECFTRSIYLPGGVVSVQLLPEACHKERLNDLMVPLCFATQNIANHNISCFFPFILVLPYLSCVKCWVCNLLADF